MFEVGKPREALEVRLAGDEPSPLRKVIFDDAGNIAFALAGGNDRAVMQRVLYVDVVDEGVKAFPSLQSVDSALNEICGIKDRAEAGEGREDLDAPLGRVAVDALLVLMAEAKLARCGLAQPVKARKDRVPVKILALGGVEAEYPHPRGTEDAGVFAKVPEGVKMSFKILVEPYLSDRRADREGADPRVREAQGDLPDLLFGELRDIPAVDSADLEEGYSVALQRGYLTVKRGRSLVREGAE